MALTKVPSNLDATVAITQSASDNSTNVATTAYVDTAITNLIDGAPGTLNTLDEIAAALNDDAALNTTLTTSIATKLPLAGGTMTGTLAMGSNAITSTGTISSGAITSTGTSTFSDVTIGGTGDSQSLIQMLANSTNGANTIHFGDATSGTASYTGYINYAHDTNQMQFATNGAEVRLRIMSDGKLLVGQTSSGTNGKLQVTGGIGLTGNSEVRQSTNADGSTLKFFGTQFVAGTGNSHSYSYSGGGLIASVSPSNGAIMLDAGANNTSGHRLKVINGSNGIDGSLQYLSGTTSLFHIDSSSGNVGIGTSSPVASSNKTVLAVQGVWGGVVDIMVGTVVHASFGTDNFASGQSARIQSQDGIVFKSGGSTERMRIDSSGNTQIGAPLTSHIGGNKLFVNKAVNAAPVTSGTTQTGGALRLRGGDNAVLDMGLNSVNTWIQATDRANLANTYVLGLNPNGGNVCIGTSSALADGLTIRREGSDKRTLLQLDRPNTPGLQTNIKFSVSNIMVGQIQHEYVSSNYNHMSFTLRDPGGADVIPLWLENSGNVGIGITTPESDLHVKGNIAQQSTSTISVSSGTGNSGINLYTLHNSYARGSGRLRVMGMENNLNVGYAEYFYAYSYYSPNSTYYVNLKFIDEAFVSNTYGRPRLYLYNSSSYNSGSTDRQNTNQSTNSTNVNILQIGITNVANAYGSFQIVAEPMHWN